MKFDHKTAAFMVLLAGVLLVGGYMLGQSRAGGAGTADATDRVAAARPASAQRPAPAPVPAPAARASAALPGDHPPVDANGAGAVDAGVLPFTHFRVGNRNVKGLLVDGDEVWIGTSGGIIRYDQRKDTHEVYDNSVDGILSNGIFHVSKLDDRIVVGTYGGGMSILDPATGRWKNYNIPDGLADQFVYGLLRSSDGDIWIATWSGVNRVEDGDLDDPDKWETFSVENTDGGLPNPWVYGLAEGPDGAMWFATEEGLARFKDGEWVNWKHADGLGAPYEAVRDSISFTNDPARYSDHHAQQKAEQGIEEIEVAYNPNYVISLEVDREGVVWAGTWGGGLGRLKDGEWRNFTTADGLPANHIFMLNLDDKGRLWIGTSHGLARLNGDGESFTVMTARDGLFADNVFSMDLAADATLWAGSFGGVARITGVN